MRTEQGELHASSRPVRPSREAVDPRGAPVPRTTRSVSLADAHRAMAAAGRPRSTLLRVRVRPQARSPAACESQRRGASASRDGSSTLTRSTMAWSGLSAPTSLRDASRQAMWPSVGRRMRNPFASGDPAPGGRDAARFRTRRTEAGDHRTRWFATRPSSKKGVAPRPFTPATTRSCPPSRHRSTSASSGDPMSSSVRTRRPAEVSSVSAAASHARATSTGT